jgi:hypothetical protein
MSYREKAARAFALGLTAIAWFAVLLQLYLSLQSAMTNGKSAIKGVEIYLSYFTVLTNLLICVSLTCSQVSPGSKVGRFFSRPQTITWIATSIAFVGLSYHFLLSNLWSLQGAHWFADRLLHYVVPVLYVIYWWITSSKVALRWNHPLIWSIYPIVYLGFALIRGRVVGSYPYPFIDVADLGYGRTLINSLGLLFMFISLGLLFVALGRMRQARC